MIKFVRVIKSNLYGLVNIKLIVILILLPISFSIYSFNDIKLENESLLRAGQTRELLGGDIFKNVLGNVEASVPDVMTISIILLPLLIIMLMQGVMLTTELQQRCRYTIPRVGSIKMWYASLIFSATISSIIYGIFFAIISSVIIRLYGLDLSYTLAGYSLFTLVLAFVFRLIIIQIIQIIFILLGNVTLSFLAPFSLVMVVLTTYNISHFLPLGGTFIIRELMNNYNVGLAMISSVATIMLLSIIGWIIARRRSFIIKGITIR